MKVDVEFRIGDEDSVAENRVREELTERAEYQSVPEMGLRDHRLSKDV
jgi:hypothetical protein